MSNHFDLIIIGAGNLGLWTAYHLAKNNFGRIALCERHWAGSGTTMRSAGIVRQQGGSTTAIKLGQWSRELYIALGDEIGLDSGFNEVGYFVLAETPEEKNAFQELVALRRACGLENEWLDANEGRARFPALHWEMFKGASFTASDGYVNPIIAARNITYAVIRSPNITLLEQCAVERIEARAGVWRVETSRGILESERVLNAGGARGANAIGALLGIEVPVSAARHTVVTFPTRGQSLAENFPMCFMLKQGIYWRPEEQGILLGFSNPAETIDTSERYQLPFDQASLNQIRPTLNAAFPPLTDLPIARGWSASIDFTPDHLPIIDEPQTGVYVLAAGGHGMMWGPGLGMKMAELIQQGEVSDLDAGEIQLARFTKERRATDRIALPFPTIGASA